MNERMGEWMNAKRKHDKVEKKENRMKDGMRSKGKEKRMK